MTIITGTFDPITEKELQALKDYRKTHHLRDLWIIPSPDAPVASFEDRVEMLKAALKPYRHLHCLSKTVQSPSFTMKDEENEKAARGGMYRLIARGARGIVFKKGIYLDETVDNMCKPHRAQHSRGVAATAAELAAAHRLDSFRAYEMGMLHDITKAWSDEQNGRIIASRKPEWLAISPKVWHSYTASVFMKEEMGWHDKEFLHAIEHHTLGDGHTAFDRILYIADKIEPGRGYDTSREKQLACRDLKAAAELILKESEEYREKTGK